MARSTKPGRWAAFPHAQDGFDYAGAALKKAWPELHRGDQEPFPDAAELKSRLKRYPEVAEAIPDYDGDAAGLAARLQDAWRAYHRGDFQQAFEAGVALGPLGACVANKAQGIHAVYLLDDERARLEAFKAVAERAERAAEAMPDDVNAHYFRAFALGRYSQGISVAKALAQGLGGKIRDSLERAVALNPKHAEAHTALGLYHAEVIDKVGSMIGGLTYGAKASRGIEHFQTALELTPNAPIAWIEYANGLLMLYGERKEDEATEAYVKASEMTPIDAMQALDVAFAQEQLE